METSNRLSLQMLESETQFAMIPRTISPILMQRSSADRLAEYGSYSSDSGVGQDYNGRSVSVEQIQNSSGAKLPVKHVTPSGTQCATLLQRYLIHSHSKCIVCKDCGIFFSYEAFLGHSHDKHGRKRHRPNAAFLELDVENPDIRQTKTWEESLVKMGQTPGTVHHSSHKFDGGDGPTEPASDLPNVNGTSVWRPEGPQNSDNGALSLSDFDRNVRESVDASERLLRETSQYLHSSAEKLRHRRQKSLRSHQFRPKALLTDETMGDDITSSGSSSGRIQPVIKDATAASRSNSTRPNRRFLEKYLEKSRDSFQLLSDSLTSKSAARPEVLKINGGMSVEPPEQPMPLPARGDEGIGRGLVRGGVLGGGGGDAERASTAHAPARPVSPGKTPHGKSIILQEHFDRNDPLFIVQTAQELLALAALKMQDNPQKISGGIDWEKRYEVEREISRDKDSRIKELEGLLRQEQRKRQDAEVQLRAIRLQNS